MIFLDYTENEYTELIKALVVATLSGIENGIAAANQSHSKAFSLAEEKGVSFQITQTIRDGDSDVKTIAEFHLAI